MSVIRTNAAFENSFVSVLDKHAPKKKKKVRENRKPHFNKNLREQIIIRSRLKNNYCQVWLTTKSGDKSE